MSARVLTVCVLTAILHGGLALSAPARAPRYDLGALDASTRLAERVWHHPCNGRVDVIIQDLGPKYDGWAEFNHTTRPYTDCRAVIDVKPWWSSPHLCTVVLHEYGHLAGLDHSPNPRSVMHPYSPTDPRCKRLFRRAR